MVRSSLLHRKIELFPLKFTVIFTVKLAQKKKQNKTQQLNILKQLVFFVLSTISTVTALNSQLNCGYLCSKSFGKSQSGTGEVIYRGLGHHLRRADRPQFKGFLAVTIKQSEAK